MHYCALVTEHPDLLYYIIYAGLLGHAQGKAEIVAGVDWDGIGVELSIFGDGAERGRIES